MFVPGFWDVTDPLWDTYDAMVEGEHDGAGGLDEDAPNMQENLDRAWQTWEAIDVTGLRSVASDRPTPGRKARTRNRGRRPVMSKAARREERAGFLFASPWLIGTLLFLIGPIIASLLLSFTDWNLISDAEWVGLENYRDMVGDRNFRQSIKVTLFYVVLAVPLFQVAGVGARAAPEPAAAGDVPVPHDPVPAGGAERRGGGGALGSTAEPRPRRRQPGPAGDRHRRPATMAAEPEWAVPAVVLMGLWGVGAGAIIYLAGLQNIPPALYQAARIDGARTWQTFRHITLPLLTPTLLFTLLIGVIAAFQVFDTAYILGREPRRDAGSAAVLRPQPLERGVPQRPVRLRLCARLGAGDRGGGRDRPDLQDVEPVGLLRVGG